MFANSMINKRLHLIDKPLTHECCKFITEIGCDANTAI